MSLFKQSHRCPIYYCPLMLWLGTIRNAVGRLFFLYFFCFPFTRLSPSVQYNDCWNVFYLCICVCLYQKGLMRSPVPRGEKGLTLAHIRASLREMADLPSSSTNTGPFTSRTERERERRCKTYTSVTPQTNVPQTHTNLYSVSSETGQLYI